LNKEFWGQITALAVIVGASFICPPAGMALGVAYGTLELSSTVSGKDWISGRKLGTGERVFRGALAPLDIVPGVSALSKFSSPARFAPLREAMDPKLFTSLKAGLHQKSQRACDLVVHAHQECQGMDERNAAAFKNRCEKRFVASRSVRRQRRNKLKTPPAKPANGISHL